MSLKATEHETQSAIMGWLENKHIFHWRSNTGAFAGEYTNKQGKTKRRFVEFGPKGGPDIFAVIRGHIFGIEVKGENGFQSRNQTEFQVEFTRTGGLYPAEGTYILAWKLEDVTRVLNGGRE